MKETRIPRALAAALIAGTLALAGCATPVRDTGHLDRFGVNDLSPKSDLFLAIDSDEDFAFDHYFLTSAQAEERAKRGEDIKDFEAAGHRPEDVQPVLFVVPMPTWESERNMDEQAMENVLFTIRERTYRYLLRSYAHPVRVRYAYHPADPLIQNYRVITLDMAVTDHRKGSGIVRYLVGYGAGAAVLQIDGRIIEGTGERAREIGRFASRESHAGYPQGYMNPSVTKASYALRYVAEVAVNDLVAALREHLPGVRPIAGATAVAARPRPAE